MTKYRIKEITKGNLTWYKIELKRSWIPWWQLVLDRQSKEDAEANISRFRWHENIEVECVVEEQIIGKW
jgi:hypothetical protein